MATKQEEGQAEAEAGKDEVLVRSVRERDRWVQLRNLELNFQLGLIDLQDLEEELKLKPLLKDSPKPNGEFEELEEDETTEKYYEVFEKQCQLLDRQKDLLKEHETELTLKQAKLKDLAGNAMIKTFQNNYRKVEKSHTEIASQLQTLSSINAQLKEELDGFRNNENDLKTRRENILDSIRKHEEGLIADRNEFQKLQDERFSSPQDLAKMIKKLEDHVKSISDLRDKIEIQKDDLFISWDDFLDLAACEKQLSVYGNCERSVGDKLTAEEIQKRGKGDLNKLYLQGRYFERRHVQPFLNQVDRNFPDKKANGLRTCGDFRNVTLKPLRPSNKGKFKKGSRYWGFAFNEKEPNRNNLDINMRVTSQPVSAYVFVEDSENGRKKALKYETSSHFAVMAGTGKRGAVPIHLEYPLKEIGEKGGKRIFNRVMPSGAKVDKERFQETSEEKDISEEHKARSRADVMYLKKCKNEYEKIEREGERKLVAVTQIYSRHKETIQRSLDLAELLANPSSDLTLGNLNKKEQDRIAREKEIEKQQKLDRKAREEEEAKRREMMEKEKKAREAESNAVLQAEYEKSLATQRQLGERPPPKQWEVETKFLADLDKVRAVVGDEWPKFSEEMDARTIELKVDAINWTMLGFGKVCSVICELADRSAYFFTVEQFLGSKDISVNDLLAAFKGDSSQTKMNLMNFASMKAPINDMTQAVNHIIFRKPFFNLIIHANSKGGSWQKSFEIISEGLNVISQLWAKKTLITSTHPLVKTLRQKIWQIKYGLQRSQARVLEFMEKVKNFENWHMHLIEMLQNWKIADWLKWLQSFKKKFQDADRIYSSFDTYLAIMDTRADSEQFNNLEEVLSREGRTLLQFTDL